jgi:hypothetical protein
MALADLDADGRDELVLPGCAGSARLSVYGLETDTLALRWEVSDPVSLGGFHGLAVFDLLGRGAPQLLYTDPAGSALYDADGMLRFSGMRGDGNEVPGTPVIADVDGDGHTELLVPSFAPSGTALLTVLGNERWVPARLIWNQYAYHVTHVLEDARIPAGIADAPQGSWPVRSTARREGNALCLP